MADLRLNFHAFIPSSWTETQVDAAHEAAAEAVGLKLHALSRSSQGLTRQYGDGGTDTLPFSYTLEPPCQLAMFGIGESRGRAPVFEPLRVAEMFTCLCVSLAAEMARTDYESGIGLVRPSELAGDVEHISWYQYFGPRIVERFSPQRLLSAPAYKVEARGAGIVMILTADPFGGDLPRRRVAEHLGITLRPLLGRNPETGAAIVIPWR